MRLWVAAGGVFFLYVAACAVLVPGLSSARRFSAAAVSVLGIAVVLFLHLLPHHVLVHEWAFPPILLLLAYRASGLLFVAPMPAIERALWDVDRRLQVDARAARLPRPFAELLELAYLGVYPLIPLSLAIHLLGSPSPDPDWFWSVVLVTDFVCFGFLPWVQTRPPRAFVRTNPWTSAVRGLNLHVLRRGSIQVNTFPSGHAAEALAAALLVSDAAGPAVLAVWVSAALVSAGAVLGRYHYAADAFAGWIVAGLVWYCTPR
ncbi:hypothetical protein BH24ACI4_BH24ACI4_11350 [soil metagenome]